MADRTPAVTPGDGIGAGTVLAFLTLAGTASSETVQLAAIAAATIVSGLTVLGHSKVRIARNVRAAIEQVKE